MSIKEKNKFSIMMSMNCKESTKKDTIQNGAFFIVVINLKEFYVSSVSSSSQSSSSSVKIKYEDLFTNCEK